MSIESLVTCPRCGADEQAIDMNIVPGSENKYVATFECAGCGLQVSYSGLTADETIEAICDKIKWG